jgi:hypothetical protein
MQALTIREFEAQNPKATTEEKLQWMSQHLRAMRDASTTRIHWAQTEPRREQEAWEAFQRIKAESGKGCDSAG